jgi:hypothetical protein
MLLLLLSACRAGPIVHGIGAQAHWVLQEADANDMARAVAQVFERFNLPVEAPDLSGEAERLPAQVRQALGEAPGGRLGPTSRTLLFLLVARGMALAAQREHLPPGEIPEASTRLAAVHAAALVRLMGEESPDLEQAVRSALERLAALPEAARRRVPRDLEEVARHLRAGRPQLEVALARVFPTAFDRRQVRLLRAAPAARLCTVRNVEAREGTLAAVSPAGGLYLAEKGSLREVPAQGPERRFALPEALAPGRLVHGPERLFHVARAADGLEAAALETAGGEARRGPVLEVRGSGFLADAAALEDQGVLALRRTFSGFELVRIDLSLRRAVREGAWPGAPGHRDGPLGRARFLPGPLARTRGGAFLFYDPAARALRILERGWVGTVAVGVGEVVGIAAGTGDQIHLVESERKAGGTRLFRQRLVRLEGLPCP